MLTTKLLEPVDKSARRRGRGRRGEREADCGINPKTARRFSRHGLRKEFLEREREGERGRGREREMATKTLTMTTHCPTHPLTPNPAPARQSSNQTPAQQALQQKQQSPQQQQPTTSPFVVDVERPDTTPAHQLHFHRPPVPPGAGGSPTTARRSPSKEVDGAESRPQRGGR